MSHAHLMTAVCIWEELLTQLNNSDAAEVGTLGDWLEVYRDTHGIFETRQLAVDLARTVDVLWEMYKPEVEGEMSFDFEFIPAFLNSLYDLTSCLNDHHEPVLLLAGFCAAMGMTPKEVEQKIKDGIWRDFEIRHVAEYRGKDGKTYVDEYDGSKDALRVFWGIYGSGPAEELPMHIVDVSYGSMALKLTDKLREMVKAYV